ncbi:uncharacterized protein LOC119675065 [Teleopsis dalmanni]|uniref:uncharacterized protein LOC119675065 n=1 Tax=Teleopsis dalmanni TaxID=139649 RepID=UPI0018CE79A4|nr:uncharacterized protein LOC119675065 [Teleopsis dalmanni]
MDVVEHDILMSAKRAKKKLSKIIDLVNSDIRKGFLGVVLNVRKRKILALKLLRHCKLRQLFVPVLESKYVLLDIFCGLLCNVNELPRTNLARQALKLEKFVRCAQILQKKPQLISDLYCLQEL